MRRAILWLAVLPACIGAAAAAVPPDLVHYQGVLRDSSDRPVDGSRDMVFRFYDAAGDATCTGGALLLTDAHEVSGSGAVVVSGGLFGVPLGSGTVTPGVEASLEEVFRDNEGVWLEVTVAGEKLCPRVRVVSAAYALNSDNLDGRTSSYFLNTSATTQEKTGLLVASGGVDFGPGASDDLTAADVSGLTSGGSADTLHTHTLVGSASNADTLDSIDSGQFLRSDTSDVFTSGTLSVAGAATLDVAGALRGARLTDRDNTAYYADPSSRSVFFDLRMDGLDLFFNYDGPEFDSGLWFYEDGSPTGETLFWDDSLDSFSFTDDVRADGSLTAGALYDGQDASYYLDPSSTALSLVAAGGLKIGAATADADDFLYFDDGSKILKWHETGGQFAFNDDLYVTGIAKAQRFEDTDAPAYYVDPGGAISGTLAGHLSIGHQSASDDDYLYFDANTEWLRWNNASLEFFFSDDVHAGGSMEAFSFRDAADTGYYVQPSGSSWMNQLLLSSTALYLNEDGPDGSTYIYFYDGASSAGQSFSWNDALDEFRLTDDLYISGAETGVEASGSVSGGYFSDSDASGYGHVGYGDWGGDFYGNTAGVWAEDLDSGNYARAGYSTYKVSGTGTVSFVQNHPEDKGSVIVYAAPEGDEVATYTRGTARLVNGEARVPLGETFRWVTNPDIGLTAHLTPRGEPVPLAVVSLTTREIVVRGRADGPPDLAFDYVVYGLRIGFEESSIVQEKEYESRIPSMSEHRALYERKPELKRYSALERFKAMGNGAPDLAASDALRAAIQEFDPAIHGGERIGPHGDAEGVAPREIPETPTDAGLPTRLDGRPGRREDAAGGEGTSAIALPADAAGDVYARSFRPSASDLASLVEVAEPVEPGDVLVLLADRPGVVGLARAASDTAVFGVVAAEPGLVLGASGSSAVPDEGPLPVPVALSGIVSCKAEAAYGAIRPGDLLTTSPTPGHAMRSDGPPAGAILGKALDRLDAGAGRIRIVVTLR